MASPKKAQKLVNHLSHEVGKSVSDAALKSSQNLPQVGEAPGSRIDGAKSGTWKYMYAAEKKARNATQQTKNWIIKDPRTTARFVGYVAVPVVAISATPLALSAVGFGSGGIVASSIAAGVQSGIGNVAAGSAFATLTSAGAGGAGLAVVKGAVGITAAVAVAAGVTAPRLIKTLRGGRGDNNTDTKEGKTSENDTLGEDCDKSATDKHVKPKSKL